MVTAAVPASTLSMVEMCPLSVRLTVRASPSGSSILTGRVPVSPSFTSSEVMVVVTVGVAFLLSVTGMLTTGCIGSEV